MKESCRYFKDVETGAKYASGRTETRQTITNCLGFLKCGHDGDENEDDYGRNDDCDNGDRDNNCDEADYGGGDDDRNKKRGKI